jgi:hypothetical protein
MLEPEIARLAIAIRDAVGKHRETNSIVTRRSVRVRRRDFNLKYHDDFGFANFAPERTESDTWDFRDCETFQNSVVRALGESTSLAATLGSKASLLETFAQNLSFASLEGLDDQELQERATAFACQLEGRPLPVKVTTFIDGLSIADSPLNVSDHVTLRRPTSEDVAEYVYLDEYGGFAFPLSETWFRVVGEFVFNAVNTGPAQLEFLRTIEALRLFRAGGVATNRYHMRSRHLLAGGTLSGSGRQSRFSYTLSQSDAAILAQFLNDIVSLVPDPLHLGESTTESGIAHARYTEALFQSGPPERCITSAMTSLEALFLKNEPELTHRRAQRVSVFLRVLGTQLDPGSTYVNVSKGYKIRSKFIHGGSLKAKERPPAESLATVLVDYARQCVLAFLQLRLAKDDLLEKLDRVMIDPSSVTDLQEAMKSVVHR